MMADANSLGSLCCSDPDRGQPVLTLKPVFYDVTIKGGIVLSRLPLPVLTVALLCLPLATQAQAPNQDFPEGPGRETFAAVCGGCHDINRARAGYSPTGWNMVVNMMQNMDAPVPPEQWPTIASYLMKSFPEQPRPLAAVINGPAQASLKMWAVPTLGSRAHDPLATKDGAIWWTGAVIKQAWAARAEDGRDQGIFAQDAAHWAARSDRGRERNIWFTGNNAGLIGKLDPNSDLVTEYKLPDAAARDPHTLIFDKDEILWFTVQQANRIGRLDPRAVRSNSSLRRRRDRAPTAWH
jgi:virginiamycin B lyase